MAEISSYQDRARTACEELVQEVVQAQGQGEQSAWGQYLEPTDDDGIYGTSAAIRILSIIDHESYAFTVDSGLDWLLREWTSPESDANENHDRAIVYRHAAVIRAFLATDRPLSSLECDETGISAETCVRDLWNMRFRRGWPEYHYGQCYEDDDAIGNRRLLSTAMALLALVAEDGYRTDDEYIEVTKKFIQDVRGKIRRYLDLVAGLHETERNTVISGGHIITLSSLALIVLCRFRYHSSSNDLKREEQAWIDSQMETMRKWVIRILRSEKPGLTECHYHFFRPEKESRDSYIAFVAKPLIALSVIESCQINSTLGKFWPRIEPLVKEVIEDVEDDGAYSPAPGRNPAVGDQVWVAELLTTLQQIDPDFGRVETIKGQARARARSGTVMFGVFCFLILVAGGLQLKGQQLLSKTSVEVLSSAVLLFAGALIQESDLPSAVIRFIRRQF